MIRLKHKYSITNSYEAVRSVPHVADVGWSQAEQESCRLKIILKSRFIQHIIFEVSRKAVQYLYNVRLYHTRSNCFTFNQFFEGSNFNYTVSVTNL